MRYFISVLSDIMLWSTLPLFGAAGYVEHGLNLSQTDHNLVLVAVTMLMFVWALFWLQVGEHHRHILYIDHARQDEPAHINTPVQMNYLTATRDDRQPSDPDQTRRSLQESHAAHD